MILNKALITLVIGLLGYLYLLININKKIYFVFLYLLFLLFGFYFINNDIFLYAPIIIIVEIFKTQYFIEGNSNNKPDTMNSMLEEKKENDKENGNKNNYDVIEFEDDDKKNLEDSQDELTDTIIGDDDIKIL